MGGSLGPRIARQAVNRLMMPARDFGCPRGSLHGRSRLHRGGAVRDGGIMRWLSMAALAGCSSYPASQDAWDAMESDDRVKVVDRGDFTAFVPVVPETGGAIAFYPGGKVEPEAYAPVLRRVAESGVASVLVRMPADLAVLAPKKGDRAMEAFDEFGPWFAAGHSLGGAMAATWFSKRLDALDGLALLAAYPAKRVDLTGIDHPVMSVTASEDGVLNWETWRERKANLPPSTLYVRIEGGNHAGFAAYGTQDGDGAATRCPEEQWSITAEALADLVLD